MHIHILRPNQILYRPRYLFFQLLEYIIKKLLVGIRQQANSRRIRFPLVLYVRNCLRVLR